MTTDPEGYTIQQLAERSGVSVRTIRFYTDEGLLAPPPLRGRYAVYDEEYVDRLELIRRLKDAFLPLKEIRERVVSLSWQEVRKALAQPVMKVGEPGERALSYISSILGEAPPRPRHTMPSSAPPSSAPAPEAMLAAPPAEPPGLPAPEAWERLTLAPGIELHVQVGISPADRRRAQQLSEYAKKLFNLSGQGGR